jgi:Phosphotransferase enzyme family
VRDGLPSASAPSPLDQALGSDLAALIRTVDEPLHAITPVSRARGDRPTAFRLEFASGRVLKGRRVDTAAKAELVEYVTKCLNDQGLPRVLKRSGTALLTEWIEGPPLDMTTPTREVLERCGAFQGRVHTWRLPEHRTCWPTDTPRLRQLRLERRLAELVERRAIGEGEAEGALHVARAYAPSTTQIGLTFGDFCAENIVQRASGEVCLVDTEELAINPCDHDLGRTWFRWPMTTADRHAYLNGYRRYRDPTGFIAHFPYWAVTAVVDSVVFRFGLGGETGRASVEDLRTLIRDVTHTGLGEERLRLR